MDGLVSPFGEQIIQELGMRVDLHSLLVGSVSIGGLFGCFISEKLEDTIGRKRAFGIAFSFTSLGWLSVLFSYTSSMVFYAVKFLGKEDYCICGLRTIALGTIALFHQGHRL